jgi:hypothetical protein
MLLSVSIVSYNTAELTLQTLQSLEADVTSSQKLRKKTEVFVVDNNSSDDSVAKIKKYARTSQLTITVIANDKNLGFAAANNQAIKQATGRYLLLLNSDTIVQLGKMEKLVQAFEFTPDEATAVLSSARNKLDHLGILAATLLNSDGTIQPQGGSFPSLSSLFFHMTLLDDLPLIGKLLPSTQHTGLRTNQTAKLTIDDNLELPPEKHDLIQSDWVGGTALMIKRATVTEIGLLDENIFMYGEDVEWCMRARAHHWDVAIHNGAYITHLQSQSSTSQNALKGELLGYLYIWSKHKPLWQLPLVKAIVLIGIILRISLFHLLNQPAKAQVYTHILNSIRKSLT